MPLDIKKELSSLRTMYESQAQNKSFNALIYGGMGTGKTNILRTCRMPVLIHSFDPGGSKTLQNFIEGKAMPLKEDPYKSTGKIFADTRYELEDPFKPTVFEMWDKEYDRLKAGGVFDQIGTYVIDSATTWSAAAMNTVLKKAGRAGSQPFQQDYLPAMVIIENAVKDMATLPCDCILLAHEDADKDEATGKMFVGPLFVGKLKYRIPILFDEIYYATTKETSQGVNYHLLTRTTGLYKARTRLGKGGLFETYEVQDIKALLKKAGYSTEDKNV